MTERVRGTTTRSHGPYEGRRVRQTDRGRGRSDEVGTDRRGKDLGLEKGCGTNRGGHLRDDTADDERHEWNKRQTEGDVLHSRRLLPSLRTRDTRTVSGPRVTREFFIDSSPDMSRGSIRKTPLRKSNCRLHGWTEGQVSL